MMPDPGKEPPEYSKNTDEDLKDIDVLCTFKIKIEAKMLNMGVPKTSDHIQSKIKMPNLSQKLPVSSKAKNEELKDFFSHSKSR